MQPPLSRTQTRWIPRRVSHLIPISKPKRVERRMSQLHLLKQPLILKALDREVVTSRPVPDARIPPNPNHQAPRRELPLGRLIKPRRTPTTTRRITRRRIQSANVKIPRAKKPTPNQIQKRAVIPHWVTTTPVTVQKRAKVASTPRDLVLPFEVRVARPLPQAQTLTMRMNQ